MVTFFGDTVLIDFGEARLKGNPKSKSKYFKGEWLISHKAGKSTNRIKKL